MQTGNDQGIERDVESAARGDAEALERVIRAIKDDMYGLAMRMLWHPIDAEDATQEALFRIATSLHTFEQRSSFRTWAFRVAVRSLLNFRRSRAEEDLSFDDFAEDLLVGLDEHEGRRYAGAERARLEAEVRIGCTQAMLLCLDRDHRIAYLLGEILEFSADEAAGCVGASSATYRKRLSRARQRVHTFMEAHCGLVSDQAPCRCTRRIVPAIKAERVDPQALLFAEHAIAAVSAHETSTVVDSIHEISRAVQVMRSNPGYEAPESLVTNLSALVQ